MTDDLPPAIESAFGLPSEGLDAPHDDNDFGCAEGFRKHNIAAAIQFEKDLMAARGRNGGPSPAGRTAAERGDIDGMRSEDAKHFGIRCPIFMDWWTER